jgi:hypothetical protein
MEELPYDILNIIYNNLDYDSRINFNRILKPEYRNFKKFKKYDLICHDGISHGDIVKGILNIQEENPYRKVECFIRMFSELSRPRFKNLLYAKKFRDQTISKGYEMLNNIKYGRHKPFTYPEDGVLLACAIGIFLEEVLKIDSSIDYEKPRMKIIIS